MLANPPSPTLGETTLLSSGTAPPTPPNDLLDDIYGSAPSSPLLSAATHTSHHDHSSHIQSQFQRDEILSDLPSRQRALDTDAYREGLSANKGQYVQEGFDEGYSLGANLGQRVGYILGVLQGLHVASQKRTDEKSKFDIITKVWEQAQEELKIEALLGRKWVDEEGIWMWNVVGVEEEPTFREVAAQHPVIDAWMGRVGELAREWGVDLERLEGRDEEEEQS